MSDSFTTHCLLDHCPPGCSVRGILQARTLEWAAISSSRGPSRPRIKLASLVSLGTGVGIFYPCASWEAPRFALVFGNLKGDLFPFYYLYCLAEGLSREKALVSALQPLSLNPATPLSCGHHRQYAGNGFGCYFLTRLHLQTLAAVSWPQIYT